MSLLPFLVVGCAEDVALSTSTAASSCGDSSTDEEVSDFASTDLYELADSPEVQAAGFSDLERRQARLLADKLRGSDKELGWFDRPVWIPKYVLNEQELSLIVRMRVARDGEAGRYVGSTYQPDVDQPRFFRRSRSEYEQLRAAAIDTLPLFLRDSDGEGGLTAPAPPAVFSVADWRSGLLSEAEQIVQQATLVHNVEFALLSGREPMFGAAPVLNEGGAPFIKSIGATRGTIELGEFYHGHSHPVRKTDEYVYLDTGASVWLYLDDSAGIRITQAADVWAAHQQGRTWERLFYPFDIGEEGRTRQFEWPWGEDAVLKTNYGRYKVRFLDAPTFKPLWETLQ